MEKLITRSWMTHKLKKTSVVANFTNSFFATRLVHNENCLKL
jgi:hypothetical protein